jgi:hypothetical protein
MPFSPSQYGNLFGKGTVQRPLIHAEGDEEIETQSTDSPGDQPSSTTQGSDTGSQDGGGGRRRDGAVVITPRGIFPAPSLNGAHMSRMGFMPTNTPVPSALNSVPAGVRYTPSVTSTTGMFVVPGFYLSVGSWPRRAFPLTESGLQGALNHLYSILDAGACPLSGPVSPPCREIAKFIQAARYELFRLRAAKKLEVAKSRRPLPSSLGALALQSNPAHYGAAEEINKGLAGVGAAGFGMMGAMIGAVAGSNLPFKDGWLYGAIAGFMLPVLVLAPKSEEAA